MSSAAAPAHDRIRASIEPPARSGRVVVPRLTPAVFTDLGVWMVGLGLLAGVVFPFFVVALGVDRRQALTVQFFGATLLAGLLVGGANWWLARLVIGTRLRALSGGMERVADALRHATGTGDWGGRDHGRARLAVDSEDELGDSARAFNELVTALERSNDVQSSIRRLFQALSSHLDVDQLATVALRWIAAHVDAPAGALLLTRGEGLRPAAAYGAIDAEALCAGPGLAAGMTETAHRAIPIVFADEAIGVLVLAGPDAPSADAERVLELFTQAVAVALNNALAHARSQELARLDPLTGCANRRSGLARLADELAAADRAAAPVGVLMIVLDHFKAINDSHGHLVGDRVLAHAARVIGACLRDGDTLVRYGGEEFLAILPGIGADALAGVGERIRGSLERSPAALEHGTVTVTASLGGAGQRPARADGSRALLEHADRALYRAKAAGRNTVVLAPAGA